MCSVLLRCCWVSDSHCSNRVILSATLAGSRKQLIAQDVGVEYRFGSPLLHRQSSLVAMLLCVRPPLLCLSFPLICIVNNNKNKRFRSVLFGVHGNSKHASRRSSSYLCDPRALLRLRSFLHQCYPMLLSQAIITPWFQTIVKQQCLPTITLGHFALSEIPLLCSSGFGQQELPDRQIWLAHKVFFTNFWVWRTSNNWQIL